MSSSYHCSVENLAHAERTLLLNLVVSGLIHITLLLTINKRCRNALVTEFSPRMVAVLDLWRFGPVGLLSSVVSMFLALQIVSGAISFHW